MSDRAGRLTLAVGALIVLLGALAAVVLGPRLGAPLIGGGTFRPSLVVPGDWRPLAWSPDGQRLLVEGAAGFALVARATTPPALSGAAAATWRPGSGHVLAVIRPSGPNAGAQLDLVDDAVGAPPTPLAGAGAWALTWSADGRRWVAWNGVSTLSGMSGGPAAPRSLGSLSGPIAVSPHGQLVAGRDPSDGAVTLVSPEALSRRALPAAMVEANGSLAYAPDGAWLTIAGPTGLRLAPISGAAPPTTVAFGIEPASVAWAPDADRLVALRTDPQSAAILISVSAKGAAVEPLGSATAVAWAADGRSVVLLTPGGQVQALQVPPTNATASPSPTTATLATDAVGGCTPRLSRSGALAYCTAGGLRVVGP